MNWQQLSQNEKNKVTVTIVVVLVIVLYTFAFLPMQQHRDNLQSQLQSELELEHYLNNTKQQLGLLPSHPALTKQQAQQIIESLSSTNKIKLNALIMQTNSSIISINKIKFSQLLDLLTQLKSKHGMVATEADIKRIDSGVVNAHFTLQHP
jgi:type II secretory pathway component PulM